MRISDWSSDVCSSDLIEAALAEVKRRNVSGDIVEFGVALGGSAILLARETSEARRFFGLDVFAMIPPPTSEKDDPKSKTRHEAIASGQAQGLNGDPYYGYRDDLYEHVSTQLARFGTPADGAGIHLVKGLFAVAQIGRASWRESVCQYGKILGGA